RTDDIDDRGHRTDFESQLLQPSWKIESDIRLPAAGAPALHHDPHELLVVFRSGTDTPRSVVEVFVEHQGATGLERASNARHQIARTFDECEDPSRPGAVGGNRGE